MARQPPLEPTHPAFTATDSSNPGVASAATTIPLNVLLSGMTITTQSLPNGVVNVPYVSTTLQQQGGTAPITWTSAGIARRPQPDYGRRVERHAVGRRRRECHD